MWVYLCILSALFFALYHMASKEFSKKRNISELFPLLYFFSFLLVIPLIFYVQKITTTSLFIKLVLFSLFASLGTFILFYTYSKTEISSTSPLLNLSPVVLFFTSFFLLGESASMGGVIGVVLIMLGGYLISLKDYKKWLHPFTSLPLKYFLLVILTIVVWSIGAPIGKMALKETNVASFLFYTILFSFLVWAVIDIKKKTIIKSIKKDWKIALFGAGLYLGAEAAFYAAISIPEVLVSLAIPIRRMSSIFVVLIGGRFFHEKQIGQKFFASLLMLAGVFIIALF